MTDAERLKTCSRCGAPKPLREFGKSTYYKTVGECDGRNIYCKQCCRALMAARRTKEKSHRRPAASTPQATSTAKVLNAIAQGHRTRDAIKCFTRLSADAVADLLAELAFDDRSIRIVRLEDDAEFHLAA